MTPVPASYCIPQSSFCLPASSQARPLAGVVPVLCRLYTGVYPRLITKSPVFAGAFALFLPFFGCFVHSRVRTGCKRRIDAGVAPEHCDGCQPVPPVRLRRWTGTELTVPNGASGLGDH